PFPAMDRFCHCLRSGLGKKSESGAVKRCAMLAPANYHVNNVADICVSVCPAKIGLHAAFSPAGLRARVSSLRLVFEQPLQILLPDRCPSVRAVSVGLL